MRDADGMYTRDRTRRLRNAGASRSNANLVLRRSPAPEARGIVGAGAGRRRVVVSGTTDGRKSLSSGKIHGGNRPTSSKSLRLITCFLQVKRAYRDVKDIIQETYKV